MNKEKINNMLNNIEEQKKFETNILEKQIKQRLNLLDKKKQLIRELTYEKDLIIDDVCNIFKNEVFSSNLSLIWGIDETAYHTAWLYHYDKEKCQDQNKAKQTFKWITDTIKEKILLNNKQFKLDEIILNGYDRKSYDFHYKYKKHIFNITIPMFATTNKDNYETMIVGYKIYDSTSPHTWSCILTNLDYRQLALDFKQYIDNLEVENE